MLGLSPVRPRQARFGFWSGLAGRGEARLGQVRLSVFQGVVGTVGVGPSEVCGKVGSGLCVVSCGKVCSGEAFVQVRLGMLGQRCSLVDYGTVRIMARCCRSWQVAVQLGKASGKVLWVTARNVEARSGVAFGKERFG